MMRIIKVFSAPWLFEKNKFEMRFEVSKVVCLKNEKPCSLKTSDVSEVIYEMSDQNARLRGLIYRMRYKGRVLVFKRRKKVSTTFALKLFSPDLLRKLSNFSKTIHIIFIKFSTVILNPNALLRAQCQNCMTWMM